jgi:SpoVK/Ycf46/Vps4 family AAA+-type ATPase
MYPMTPALITAAARAAHAARAAAPLRAEHIQTGIRAVLDDRLAGLATRVTVNQTWDDLVLPDDQLAAIIELLARIRERRRVYEDWGFADKLGRGLGIAALLSGPPGTGKTMAAGLIARDLGCELYQVDTTKITSKWIGETEKNLAALFDAAEADHAILLFDEADTLFGKRTDVKSSNDRHANQEVNFLLQRIESYTGICILTTNHETALDEAFRRRLSVHVRFPMPEADERARLWQALLPSTAPTTGHLALDRHAETFVMSGGYIRNAVHAPPSPRLTTAARSATLICCAPRGSSTRAWARWPLRRRTRSRG